MLLITEKIATDLLSISEVKTSIINALEQQAKDQVSQSEPRSLFLNSNDKSNRYHVKGAYLSKDLVVGFRVREYSHIPTHSAEMQLILLSHLKTAAFLGLVSCDRLSELRYGVMVALTIQSLRKSSSKKLALIGAGNLARAAMQAIQEISPFRSVRVASRSKITRKRFCEEMAANGIPNIKPAASIERACHGADVILTITNAEAQLIKNIWCNPGSLLVTTGGRQECEPDAILKADKIFIDDWDQCTVLGDLATLYMQDKLGPENVTATLAEAITARHPGREKDTERIVAVPQGLTSLDVALAFSIFQIAMKEDLGTNVEWP